MALALYRKYRPRTFAEVIGQEHVTEPLSQALRSGRLHHAYLFSGPRGCGKTSSARILARSLNCEQGPTPEPCGACASCRSLANDGAGSIDVIEIDAASHGGVDDARELREKAFFAPASSRYKIYVIDEAHMVSSAGFNALLKLVEEPPDYVKFIFATTEPEKVLGTIRSRTHHYPFRLIPPAVLRPYLQQLTDAEGVAVEPAVFPLVVRAGGGSARDTLSVLDQLIAGAGPEGVSYTRAVALLGVTDVTLIDEMCDALAAGDGAAAFAAIDRVAEAGHDPRRFASDLLERFRDLIVLQQVPDAVTKGLIDGPADQLDAMAAQATRLGPATLSRCADIVHNGLVEMRGTTAPRLLLELITARMLLPGADDSTGALLQRLERMERRLTLAPDPELAPPTAGVAGGGGLSAARAAAAAAGRRPPSGTPGAPVPPPTTDSTAPGSSASDLRGADLGAEPQLRPDGPGRVEAAPAGEVPGSSARSAGTGDDRSHRAGVAPPGAEPAHIRDSVGRERSTATTRDPAGAGPGADSRPAPDDVEFYDEEPPWDDEPEPEFTRSESGRSESTGSGSDRAESDRSASVQPGGIQPGAARAGAVQPGAAQPGAAQPGAARAGTAQPESADLGLVEPELGRTNRQAPVAPAGAGGSSALPAGAQAGTPLQNRRGEPAGLLPDPPADPAAALRNDAPGRLDATAIRGVWPEIVTAIGRQSKKVAALLSGATVRDLDGDAVVLTFRFPAHARMVAPEAPLIATALYEALGGHWEVRCEVAGEAGAIPTGPAPAGTDRVAAGRAREGVAGSPSGTTPGSASRPDTGQTAVRGQTEALAGRQPVRASDRARQSRRQPDEASTGSDDDWPEPVRPGGPAGTPANAAGDPADDEEWPEVQPIGGAVGAAAGSARDDRADPATMRDGIDADPAAVPSAASTLRVVTDARTALEPSRDRPDGQAAAAGGSRSSDFAGADSQAGAFAGSTGMSAESDGPGSVSGPPAQRGPAGASGSLPQDRSAAGLGSDDGSATTGGGLSDARSAAAGSVSDPGSASASGWLPDGRAAAVSVAETDSGGLNGSSADGGSGAASGPEPGRRVSPAGRNAGPSSGLAAARAAAAGARGAGATAGGRGAAARQAARPAAGPTGSARANAFPGQARPAPTGWSDGSPTEEAPYDPEFDGPPRLAPAGYEGFDPGDEPLDDVIDEKTARESSEQQAMRLLQDAFGAEKIGEA